MLTISDIFNGTIKEDLSKSAKAQLASASCNEGVTREKDKCKTSEQWLPVERGGVMDAKE